MMKNQQHIKKNISDQLASQIGKVPPQALEVEEAVLGALLLEEYAITAAGDILQPESFYSTAHQTIYRAIVELNQKAKKVDMLTVIEELKRMKMLEEVGGAGYVSQLTDKVASASHIETHARIIQQKFIQRELIRISSETLAEAYDESNDVADLLDKTQQNVFEIAEENIKRETQPISIVADKTLQIIGDLSKQKQNVSGVPSGFTDLDKITAGWQKSDLIILAARPAMGKTAFVLSMARNMAVIHQQPVVVFSLEMSSIQLVNRLIASETELGSEKLRNGSLQEYEWEQLNAGIKDLVKAPIYIDDTPALSIFELRSKVRRLKKKYNISCLIIDYLQLMTAGNVGRGNREQEVSLISRQLKIIAKEMDIPVIAISQLNRGIEQRSGDQKKPMLSDLRESGAIEQDADMVLFIHRPEVYGITEDSEGNSLIGLANVIIAKHRNGSIGEITLRFRKALAKFTNKDDDALVQNTFMSNMYNKFEDIDNTDGIEDSDISPNLDLSNLGNNYTNDDDDRPF